MTASLLTWLDANWANAIGAWVALSFTCLFVWIVLCEFYAYRRRAPAWEDAGGPVSALDQMPALVSSLTGRIVELEDRIARRDETIADLVAENERLLRELAEVDACSEILR
jgi:hypothetical protein